MLNRSRRSAAAALVVAAAIGMAAAAPAHAYNHWPNNYHLTYGVAGQQFWIGSNATSNQAAIVDAMQSWNAASAKVSYSRTTVQANSRLDFRHPAPETSACATTLFYVNTTDVTNLNTGQPTSNYWWAKIQIRSALNDDPIGCGPVSHRKGVLAHEVGHAFGLAHVNGGAPRIMQQYISHPQYWNVNTPQADDVQGVNALY